jgi:hypothetical protein
MDPLSLLCRLAAAMHPPKFHVVRYAGVLASAHHVRSLHRLRTKTRSKAFTRTSPTTSAHRRIAAAYRPWAELMKRSFAIEVDKCAQCGARLRLRVLRVLVTAAASIGRYLRYLGEPPLLPPLSPASGPPYFKSRVLRRKLGELEGISERRTQMFSPERRGSILLIATIRAGEGVLADDGHCRCWRLTPTNAANTARPSTLRTEFRCASADEGPSPTPFVRLTRSRRP